MLQVQPRVACESHATPLAESHLGLKPAEPRQKLEPAGDAEHLDAVLPRPLDGPPRRVVLVVGAAEDDVVEEVAHVVVRGAVGHDAVPALGYVFLQAGDVLVDASGSYDMLD